MTYDELVELARRDGDVLGLVLTGSRATGIGVSDGSDWDVRLVVRDVVRDEYRSWYETPHGSRAEVVVLGESDLEQAGELGTPTAWDRYSWVHAQVVVDAGGRIAELVAALLPRLGEILDTASVDTQQRMFRDVESLALGNGLGDVIAGWEPDVEWLRGGR